MARFYATSGKAMSRVGKKPINLPPGVEVLVNEVNEVVVRGPKGELRRSFHPDLSIKLQDGTIVVTRPTDNRIHRSLHGLTRALLANMVQGVSEGFTKTLEVVGTGYRAQKVGEKLVLQLGYSHPVEFVPPPGVSISVEGNRVKVSGIDKELVGEVAARIRRLRPPDRYKGKGVRYLGEQLMLKPGKAGKVGKR